MSNRNRITLKIDVDKWLKAGSKFYHNRSTDSWTIDDGHTKFTVPFASQAWCSIEKSNLI